MITQALGIRGWGEIYDRLLLTGIVSGDPLLIISNYGQAKTVLVKRLGHVLVTKLRELRPEEPLTVGIINGAVADPQDWAGYFVPPGPDDPPGQMKLLKSPQSLLDAVMIGIDEMSRAEGRNQNKILSLIQDREIDGLPGKAEVIFGLMNPVMGDVIDEGAEPLIPPLADRLALFLEPPAYHTMEESNKRAVVEKAAIPAHNQSLFATTSVALGDRQYRMSQSTINDLWDAMRAMKQRYLDLFFSSPNEKWLANVFRYVVDVSTYLASTDVDVYVSGRRAGMLVRNIIAAYAVSEILGTADLAEASEIVLLHSFGNRAMGRDYNPEQVKRAHDVSRKILSGRDSAMIAIMSETSKWRRLQLALRSELRPDEFARIYKEAIKEKREQEPEWAETVIGFALLPELTSHMTKHELSEIADQVLEVSQLAVPSVSIPLDENLTSEVLETMLNPRKDQHAARILTICIALMERTDWTISELWADVSRLYYEALSLTEETEEAA